MSQSESRSYPPSDFLETRREVLTAFVRAHPFGHLITAGPEGLLATPVPFVLTEGPDGALSASAHLAARNPQARTAAREALLVFQGPHAYVRPAWYDTTRAVPTWDYISVQARGPLRLTGSGAPLMPHLTELAAQSEAPFADPWSPQKAPADYVAALSNMIVGVEIGPLQLEGVWKLHQNHGATNRRGVIEGLTALGDPASVAIAAAIAGD